jgi:hypothetical protein
MIESLRIGMAILSVYRISQLITLDGGPYACFERLRLWLDGKAPEDNRDIWWNLTELFECPYCMGVWIALLILPLILWPGIVGDAILLWIGVAGGQAFLEASIGANDK